MRRKRWDVLAALVAEFLGDQVPEAPRGVVEFRSLDLVAVFGNDGHGMNPRAHREIELIRLGLPAIGLGLLGYGVSGADGRNWAMIIDARPGNIRTYSELLTLIWSCWSKAGASDPDHPPRIDRDGMFAAARALDLAESSPYWFLQFQVRGMAVMARAIRSNRAEGDGSLRIAPDRVTTGAPAPIGIVPGPRRVAGAGRCPLMTYPKEGNIMATCIDLETLQMVIDLDDAARAAVRAAAGGRTSAGVLSDDAWLRPPTPEERLLRQRLGELDDAAWAQLLALYWAGRRITFGEEVDDEAYRTLLAHAAANLDGMPGYLAGKSNLGDALRAGRALLGAWAPCPGVAGPMSPHPGRPARRPLLEGVEGLPDEAARRSVDDHRLATGRSVAGDARRDVGPIAGGQAGRLAGQRPDRQLQGRRRCGRHWPPTPPTIGSAMAAIPVTAGVAAMYGAAGHAVVPINGAGSGRTDA